MACAKILATAWPPFDVPHHSSSSTASRPSSPFLSAQRTVGPDVAGGGWSIQTAAQLVEFKAIREEYAGARDAVERARFLRNEHLDKDMQIRVELKDAIDLAGELNSKWVQEYQERKLAELHANGNGSATVEDVPPMPPPALCSRDGLLVYHIDE